MEKLITIYNTEYAIPAVFSYSQKHEKMPAVILCHGTGSQKNEVGNLFAEMSKRLIGKRLCKDTDVLARELVAFKKMV